MAVSRFEDLLVRFGEQLLVADVLPDNQSLDNAVQSLPLGLLVLLSRELIRMRGGVVD